MRINFSRGARMEAAERKLFIKMNTWSVALLSRPMGPSHQARTGCADYSEPECEGV
ncbi:MAG: hypothetical protein QOJ04_5738 [Caballeronia sp.]|nr:hypothetical protein [Caballeronia sp.]